MTDEVGKVMLIGVEIEGGFNRQVSGEEYHHDGSVDVSTDGYLGEVVSRPMSTLDQVYEWIDRVYPDQSNSSCGTHVHVSFNNNLAYMQTMSQSFYDYFMDRMELWGKKAGISEKSAFWSRLKGENRYCKRMPKAARVIQAQYQKMESDYGTNRYYQLNHCWSKHRTLECRLLPVFKDKKFTKAGVREFVSICNTYLKKQRGEPEFKHEIEYSTNNEHSLEVICL